MKYIKRYLYFLLRMSIIKTLIFNFRYFGIRGILLLPVLVGKNVEFHTLKGKFICEEFKTGIVQIGLNDMGNHPKRTTYVSIQNNGTIRCKGKVYLGVGTRISNGGILVLGNNFSITADTSIICANSIIFEDDVLVSWGCQIMDTDLHKIFDIDTNQIINSPKEIYISEHCWICSGCKILKGVKLASNIIVAANSIITKSILTNNVIVGFNNRVLKENVNWKV